MNSPVWWQLISKPSRHIPLAAAVLVFAGYLLSNFWVGGPVHPYDEIGYLKNAAFLAGRFVDGASSYQLGYSIFIAPLFYFSSDPYWVWKGVLAVNALLWGGTVALLAKFIILFRPDFRPYRIWLILAVLAFYPGSVVISGYAFSQSAVAFVFVLATVALCRFDPARPTTILLHSAGVGFLCWIHPTGLAVLVASVLTLLLLALRNGAYRHLLLSAAVSVGLAVAYITVVDPWRVQEMTLPGGVAELHYPKAQAIISGLIDIRNWPTIIGMALGQISYLIVATFGFAAVGVWHAVRIFFRKQHSGNDGVAQSRIVICVFAVLSILGCIAISTVGGRPDRVDQWFYGRYLDPIFLPVFALGLLHAFESRNGWARIACALSAVLVAVWLVDMVKISGPVDRLFLAGLWPSSLVPGWSVKEWFWLGLAGVAACVAMPRPLALVGIVAIYAATIGSQLKWHSTYLVGNGQGNPSEVVDFVYGNFESGCVFFDESSISASGAAPVMVAKPLLYSFYFFAYDFESGAAKDWQDTCDGPLLTYDPSPQVLSEGSVVGVEKITGLRVVVKGSADQFLYPKLSPSVPSESYWISSASPTCLTTDSCLAYSAKELESWTQVGVSDSRGLVTTSRSGYLFFGPYVSLSPGDYELRVDGAAASYEGAKVDISSHKGSVTHAEGVVAPVNGELARIRFTLHERVDDIEVRLLVRGSDELAVSGYVLEPMEPAEIQGSIRQDRLNNTITTKSNSNP